VKAVHSAGVKIKAGVLGVLIEDAEILVSELLTNALKASWALPTPTPIALRLLANDRQLLIEAWDQWVEGYQLRAGAPDADHGRGLTVVAALAKRWGVGRIGEELKVVWCELCWEDQHAVVRAAFATPMLMAGRPSVICGPLVTQDHRLVLGDIAGNISTVIMTTSSWPVSSPLFESSMPYQGRVRQPSHRSAGCAGC
jgi:hypothetical protein